MPQVFSRVEAPPKETYPGYFQSSTDPHFDLGKRSRVSAPISFLALVSYLVVVAVLFLNGHAIKLSMAAQLYDTRGNSTDCACDYNPAYDYFPVKLSAQYAQHFNLTYHMSYKKLVVTAPGAAHNLTTYYLYLCGTPIPEEAVQATANNVTNVMAIEIPIRTAALSATVYVPLFEYLSARSHIVYVEATETSLNACLRKMYDAHDLEAVDGSESSYGVSLDDVFAFNKTAYRLSGAPLDVFIVDVNDYNSDVPVLKQYIPSVTPVYMADVLETTPEGIVEWLEVVAALLNRETAAYNIANLIYDRYTCNAGLVAARHVSPKPKVLIASYYVSDVFPGYFGPSPYWHDIIGAAGGQVIDIPGGFFNGNNHTQFIELYANQADYWIYIDGNWDAESNLGDEEFFTSNMSALYASVPVIVNQRVWDIKGTNLAQWFERKNAQPDVLLLDLIQVLWGQAVIPTSVRAKKVFLRNVFTEAAASQAPLDPSTCPDTSAPLYSDWLDGPCSTAGNPVNVTVPPRPSCEAGFLPGGGADVSRSLSAVGVVVGVVAMMVMGGGN